MFKKVRLNMFERVREGLSIPHHFTCARTRQIYLLLRCVVFLITYTLSIILYSNISDATMCPYLKCISFHMKVFQVKLRYTQDQKAKSGNTPTILLTKEVSLSAFARCDANKSCVILFKKRVQ